MSRLRQSPLKILLLLPLKLFKGISAALSCSGEMQLVFPRRAFFIQQRAILGLHLVRFSSAASSPGLFYLHFPFEPRSFKLLICQLQLSWSDYKLVQQLLRLGTPAWKKEVLSYILQLSSTARITHGTGWDPPSLCQHSVRGSLKFLPHKRKARDSIVSLDETMMSCAHVTHRCPM